MEGNNRRARTIISWEVNAVALSLGVQAGSRIKVGLAVVKVIEILNNGLEVVLEAGGNRFVVNDEEKKEILPSVFVFCGISAWMYWDQPYKSKLAFDAPRSIAINRINRINGHETV